MLRALTRTHAGWWWWPVERQPRIAEAEAMMMSPRSERTSRQSPAVPTMASHQQQRGASTPAKKAHWATPGRRGREAPCRWAFSCPAVAQDAGRGGAPPAVGRRQPKRSPLVLAAGPWLHHLSLVQRCFLRSLVGAWHRRLRCCCCCCCCCRPHRAALPPSAALSAARLPSLVGSRTLSLCPQLRPGPGILLLVAMSDASITKFLFFVFFFFFPLAT